MRSNRNFCLLVRSGWTQQFWENVGIAEWNQSVYGFHDIRTESPPLCTYGRNTSSCALGGRQRSHPPPNIKKLLTDVYSGRNKTLSSHRNCVHSQEQRWTPNTPTRVKSQIRCWYWASHWKFQEKKKLYFYNVEKHVVYMHVTLKINKGVTKIVVIRMRTGTRFGLHSLVMMLYLLGWVLFLILLIYSLKISGSVITYNQLQLLVVLF